MNDFCVVYNFSLLNAFVTNQALNIYIYVFKMSEMFNISSSLFYSKYFYSLDVW